MTSAMSFHRLALVDGGQSSNSRFRRGWRSSFERIEFLSREGQELCGAIANTLSNQRGSDFRLMQSLVMDAIFEIPRNEAFKRDELGTLWAKLSTLISPRNGKIRVDMVNGRPAIARCRCGKNEIAFVRHGCKGEFGQFSVSGRGKLSGFCSRCLIFKRKRRNQGNTKLIFFPLEKAWRAQMNIIRKRARNESRRSTDRKRPRLTAPFV